VVVAVVAGAIGSGLISYDYTSKNRHRQSDTPPTEHQRRQLFDGLATKFDGLIGLDEWLLGLRSLRKEIISRASGNVLEVAAGTGRNIYFYDKSKVKSITMSDFSRPMLQVASKKTDGALYPFKLRYILQNTSHLDFEDDTFDCVVDTFGLCSYENPVTALKEMWRVCKKDTGEILLLEHGQAKYGWLRSLMANRRDIHCNKFGCVYDRDIVGIVEDAGVSIKSIRRMHWGTTYSIIGTGKQR